jgi:hypothetical protein
MNKAIVAGMLGITSIIAGCNGGNAMGMKTASRNVAHLLETQLAQSGAPSESLVAIDGSRRYVADMRPGQAYFVLVAVDAMPCDWTMYQVQRTGELGDDVAIGFEQSEGACADRPQGYPATNSQKADVRRGLNLIIQQYIR